MKFKLTFIVCYLFIVSCKTHKKDITANKSDLPFIDSTDFKYFGLEKFDIQDWYDGKIELKTLTKKESEKFYQYRLRQNTSDIEGYYKFYSIQKNLNDLKIITIIEGATGNFPDLRMLIYNERDSLIAYYPLAGIGRDPDWESKYKVTSKKINDTTYISTRISEYNGDSETGTMNRDSIVTRFEIGLGFMKEEKIIEKQEFKLR